MKIPDDWRQQMLSSEETEKVLANVDAERCVSNDLQQAFHDGLIHQRPYTSHVEAQKAARTVVEAKPDKFLCQGRVVPDDRFTRAVRFLPPESWPYLVTSDDDDEEERIRRRYGLMADSTLGNVSDRQRAGFAAHLAKQDLQVGKPNLIAWVTESEVVPWRGGGLRDILRCMGLPHFEAKKLTIVLEYDKVSVGRSFHVPRAFDGIDWWAFRLQDECDSPVGMTQPLDVALPDGKGYPESVHRSKRFRVDVVEVRTIDD